MLTGSGDRGYTLIEWLVAAAVVCALGLLSVGAYYVYKNSVEYQKTQLPINTQGQAVTQGWRLA